MRRNASAYDFAENGRAATKTCALEKPPPSGSHSGIAMPAQSTCMHSAGLHSMRMVAARLLAHFRCLPQNAECWKGLSPAEAASAQYSLQRSVIVTPRRPSSRSTRSWSIGARPASAPCPDGYILALIAASSISSGSGRSTPAAEHRASTTLTVERAHPTESATVL